MATRHKRARAETPSQVPMSRGHTRRGCRLVTTTAGARLGVVALRSVIAVRCGDATAALTAGV